MKKKKVLTWLAPLLFVVLFLGACGKKEADVKILKTPYEDKQFLLGTYVDIRIYDDGKEEVLQEAFKNVKALGDKITVNQEGSELDKVNEQAGVKPVVVSEDVYRLAKKAYEYSQDSTGGFDMAIGPITSLWRIGFPDARKPEESEIQEALKLVDYKKVKLNDQDKSIYLEEKGMKLDFGAIAKGFITDEVVALLKKNKVTTAIVDLGGNIYVLGNSIRSTADDQVKWTVGIQDPNQARNVVLGQIPESNKSLVTSGIYERYLKVDGKTYHHLFNPKTGYPFDNDIAGVTVITDHSVDGDGLSTALFSMGVKKGMAYVEKDPKIDAIFVTTEGKVYVSSRIEKQFKLNEEAGYTLGDNQDLK